MDTEAELVFEDQSLASLGSFLRNHLLESIMPFWTTHAVDSGGGLNNSIRDDGTIVNRDKWLWSQWRAVWVFSKLYNSIERRTEWLDIARGIYEFSSRHGWLDKDNGWALQLSGEGEVLRGYESIYVDGFAIYGLTEFAAATGDEAAAALAVKTADHVLARLRSTPLDQLPHFPYPIPPGSKMHGVPMILSLVFWELGQFLDEQKYRDAALTMADEIFGSFYRSDRNVLLECIRIDGGEYPAPKGTAVVPGHVIEDMWFQMKIAHDCGDTARIGQAVALVKRHMELGWDEKFGGLLLAVDADGSEEVGWGFADTKLWWPQTEAMVALLMAHVYTGDNDCLEWYRRVHRYAFAHYPAPEHGEWVQKLSRDGSPLTDTIALPVKDPFHLPRSLIVCAGLCAAG